eukprot:TRINITY_DN7364_c0_g1_i1.p1 TRINITY_DN7364_c0_g1~~TRINITY_DN7364_c0_g1_i1.p1  ORF type:complete len:316 (-),score=38.17 TRINITY_DN7364_c0_g1_i1:657-1604(-)
MCIRDRYQRRVHGSHSSSSFYGSNKRRNQKFEEDLFDDFEAYFNMRMRGENAAHEVKGQDVNCEIHLSFKEAVFGARRRVEFLKKCTCSNCRGSKCRPGTSTSRCFTCGGRGVINYRYGLGTAQTTCNKCQGQGFNVKHPCEPCRGTGMEVFEHFEEIIVPKGINHGQVLKFPTKGNINEAGGAAGDLLVKCYIEDDTFFRREGYDVHTEHLITITQAVLGDRVTVHTLYGEIDLNVERGTQDGDVRKLSNYGIHKVNSRSSEQRGNHYVRFKVIIPKILSQEQRRLFEEIEKASEEEETDKKDFSTRQDRKAFA